MEEHTEQPSLLTHDQAEEKEPTVTETLKEDLDHRSLTGEEEHGDAGQRDADPVWTWNAPDFLTGDTDGTRRDLGRSSVPEKLTLKEKTENLRLYFGSLEDYERRKGGRTHYRIILSFDVPATNRQIRDLANNFLEQAFPKAIAFGAIHRDTDHPHAHLYLNSRQTDGRRIQLKNNEFKTIDEKWSKIYTDFAGDKSAHVEYLRKKEETKQWKIAAAEAYRRGEPIPPKPERDNDRREKLAEQRLAAQRSEARDRGRQLESQQAEPVIRPASEKQTSRLLARTEVAREHLAHLIRTDAPEAEIKSASRIAHDLSTALSKTLTIRKDMGREKPPQIVYTTEEWKQLKEYRASSDTPVKDDRAASRLQANCVLAGAEMTDAKAKAETFQVSRHLWKFEVEGWDRRLSLKDIEQAIRAKSDEQLRLRNFLRPTKREEIQSQIDYLHETKKDVQKQLAARELSIERNVGAEETRYQVSRTQVLETEKARSHAGRAMPPPIHEKGELTKIGEIAARNSDGRLLRYSYEQIKDKLLTDVTPEALSRIKGHVVMAKLEMISQADRLANAIQFGEFRQLPLKDLEGLLYTKSIREVAPRSALETVIRHFTDSAAQKRERQDLTDTLRHQLEVARGRSSQAVDYHSALNKILGDHCRAVGAFPNQIRPDLNSQQIAEVREYAEKQPFLSASRREFGDAARQAEELLHERQAAESARQAEQARTQDLAARSREQSESRSTPHVDRDSYSRGR